MYFFRNLSFKDFRNFYFILFLKMYFLKKRNASSWNSPSRNACHRKGFSRNSPSRNGHSWNAKTWKIWRSLGPGFSARIILQLVDEICCQIKDFFNILKIGLIVVEKWTRVDSWVSIGESSGVETWVGVSRVQ